MVVRYRVLYQKSGQILSASAERILVERLSDAEIRVQFREGRFE